jgi:hypothetical protein
MPRKITPVNRGGRLALPLPRPAARPPSPATQPNRPPVKRPSTPMYRPAITAVDPEQEQRARVVDRLVAAIQAKDDPATAAPYLLSSIEWLRRQGVDPYREITADVQRMVLQRVGWIQKKRSKNEN